MTAPRAAAPALIAWADTAVGMMIVATASAGALLLPGLKRIGERPLAGSALLHGDDGAAAVAVPDRNVEPRTAP